jgi:tetratricopeptide (TPR) repeat protein
MKPGDVIGDRFELTRRAASGGMGEVWRARDRRTGGEVALKTTHDRLSTLVARRFEREAALLAGVDHPAVVRYVAHGWSEDDGERWLAMEWLEGESLSARLFRGPLDLEDALLLGRRVAAALAALHRRGVVHRDVKPSNLILVGGEIEGVKLVDFGVARAALPSHHITVAGSTVGTPGYMAPEQARGEDDIDTRADVYALGCVIFECVAGREVFTGPDALAVLLKAALEEAPRLREIAPEAPPALDDLLAAMLAKTRDLRPPDGDAVIALLDTIAAEPEAPPSVATAEVLGGAERRVVSLVVARPGAPVPDDLLGRIRADAAPRGGEVTILADGAVAVSLAGGGAAATDLASQAAQAARAIEDLLPGAAIAVVSGRAVLHGKLPLGEVIDRASAMLAGRRAPGVDLDEVTAGLARGRFDVTRDLGGLRLAGGALGGGARDPARVLLGRPTPCVGRDEEIALLERAFAACASDRAPRAALVTAPAGVGKSRLAYELTRRLRASGAAEIWIGRGDPMHAGAAFGVLGQALRGALRADDATSPSERRDRVRARVAACVPEPEAARVAEFLGEIVGAPFPDDESERLRAARRDPRLMGDQTRRAFVDFVRAACARGPVLLLLEDLHHGDLPSVSFADAALSAGGDLPLFVLGLARPEVAGLFPGLWQAHAPIAIALAGLTAEASVRLAEHMLGDALDRDALARLAARADGNAFYLEELIRATAAGRGGALPETVLAMAQARIDVLAPSHRRTLRAASVLGETFSADAIAALRSDVDRAALAGLLDELVEAEVLTRAADGEGLAFRHALLREAAYGMLTPEDRARAHRLAGAWLEASGSRDAAALAEHFERGGEPARAAAWYRRAAEEALEGDDLAVALARADRGLACAGSGADPADTGALHLLIAEASFWRGDLRTAMARGEAALAALPPGTPLFYRATGHVALVASRLANVDRVRALSAVLRAPNARPDAADARVLALNQAVMGLFVAGCYEDADALLAVLGEALATQTLTDPAVRARTWYSLARQAHVHGDLGEMLRRRREAAAEARRADDRRMICTFGLGVGDALLHLGAYAEAERELSVVVPEAERLGLASMATAAKLNLGMALAAQRRLREAQAMVEEAASAFAAQGDQACEATARVYASLIQTSLGRVDRAEREARAALALAADPPARAYALAALGVAMLVSARVSEALAAAGEGHRLLSTLGTVEEGESLIRLAWAEALHAAGDRRAASVIAEARRVLLHRAGAIRDPAVQRAFLEQVPENQRTLALARRWLGE